MYKLSYYHTLYAICEYSAGELISLRDTFGDKRVSIYPLDVTSTQSFTQLATSLSENNIDYIDVLIANAGIDGKRQPLMECDAEDLMQNFNTNVIGTLLTMQVSRCKK
jgi:NADP-dependent 3-hydroxy acid dehydrogenase YdfG